MRAKKTLWVTLLVALLIAGLFVSTARAGKFHFNRLSFELGSLIAEGTLVGLGNETAVITLTAQGKVTAICQNPGGLQAPGRNPVSAEVQQTATFVTDEFGRALVVIEASDPTLVDVSPSPTPKTAGCPNGKWSVVGISEGSTDWTAAQIVVRNKDGVEELSLSFTCKTTFKDGVGVSVECTEI